MKKVKLQKEWSSHKKGSVIEVDDLRATWLEKHGYLEKGSTAKRKEG